MTNIYNSILFQMYEAMFSKTLPTDHLKMKTTLLLWPHLQSILFLFQLNSDSTPISPNVLQNKMEIGQLDFLSLFLFLLSSAFIFEVQAAGPEHQMFRDLKLTTDNNQYTILELCIVSFGIEYTCSCTKSIYNCHYLRSITYQKFNRNPISS